MQKPTNNECIGITATNDVSFRKDGIKHKLVASGIMRYGIEGTNYWNSKDQVVIETNIPASLNPIEKLTALKEYVNSQRSHGINRKFCTIRKKTEGSGFGIPKLSSRRWKRMEDTEAQKAQEAMDMNGPMSFMLPTNYLQVK